MHYTIHSFIRPYRELLVVKVDHPIQNTLRTIRNPTKPKHPLSSSYLYVAPTRPPNGRLDFPTPLSFRANSFSNLPSFVKLSELRYALHLKVSGGCLFDAPGRIDVLEQDIRSGSFQDPSVRCKALEDIVGDFGKLLCALLNEFLGHPASHNRIPVRSWIQDLIHNCLLRFGLIDCYIES